MFRFTNFLAGALIAMIGPDLRSSRARLIHPEQPAPSLRRYRYRPAKVRNYGSKLARKAAAGTLTKIHY